jgi:hypothetical protein
LALIVKNNSKLAMMIFTRRQQVDPKSKGYLTEFNLMLLKELSKEAATYSDMGHLL